MPVDPEASAHALPPEPWRSFLQDFDARLKGTVALRCLGGFVVTLQYGIGRGTSDIDFLSVTAMSAEDNVEVLGGLDCDVLKARYLEEVRPYLLNKHEWHDQTLELWVEMIAAPSSNSRSDPE
jgi:hypothetical protein